MKPLLKTLTAAVASVFILGACATGTPYQRPDAAMATMPGQWNTAGGEDAALRTVSRVSAVSIDWWKQFGSAELDRMMTQALAANHDIAAAVSRIAQARGAAGIVDASRAPTVDLAGSAARTRSNQSGIGGTSTGAQSSQLSATVTYELDLWGGKAAASDAARARVDYSVYDREAVALLTQAEVAANYFEALAAKDRLAIARQNLEAARNVLSLVEVRHDKGADSGLELSQQRTSVLNIEAQIPQLEQQLRAAQTALAVLLGRAPQDFAIEGESLASLQLPALAAYQPAALLERRPDIRKAEASLEAAHADIGAARAALYPSIRLSATAVAGGVLTSGSSFASSLAASLAQTLFDGGRLRGQVTQSEARKTELVEQYLQSVLTGLKEVQDSLDAASFSETRRSLLARAAAESQEAYRIANVRYKSGSQDLLTLLDSQRTRLQAEDSRVQADLARFSAAVNLYKALGGGWAGNAG
ncbi:efflux transporter outer membrane subunit [Noviherbaspirillum malthae]|uniref:efflux transporter outer membrane subunit n=1 Tax=Noviherbaspirillum malthae TaxID=1260987 RepID=UPI00189097C7|nr:efflux transporter outer membrane subunit [Noviherbaspirillum malthae]